MYRDSKVMDDPLPSYVAAEALNKLQQVLSHESYQEQGRDLSKSREVSICNGAIDGHLEQIRLYKLGS